MKPLQLSLNASTYKLINKASTYLLEGWVFKLMKCIPREQQAKPWSLGGGEEENRVLLQRIQPGTQSKLAKDPSCPSYDHP